MNNEVRKYFAEIGRKGGKANKGKAAEKCRAAARARWAAVRKANEETDGAAPDKDKEREP